MLGFKQLGSPTLNSNSNIPANLDLAQSLETFEETIAEVLVLGDVREWDGRTLKQREEQIRQAALILAGQCVALLLHSLSQSMEAQTGASNRWGSTKSTLAIFQKIKMEPLTANEASIQLAINQNCRGCF